VLLAALVSGAVPVKADGRPYIAGPGDLTTVNCGGQTAAPLPSLGGVCVAVPAGASTATIRIRDLLGNAVRGEYYYRDATDTGITGTEGILCGDRTVPVPADASQITVYINTALSLQECGLIAKNGTTGTVDVVFDSPIAPPPLPTTGSGSPNIKPVANIRYPVISGWPWPGGTDLEFVNLPYRGGTHRFAITGTYQNGMQIIDVTTPTAPAVVAAYDCKIYQADIQIFRREDGHTYVAYAVDDYSRTDVNSACFRDVGYQLGDVRYGTFIIDITAPDAPHAVSFMPFPQGSHNTTIDPTGHFIYSSNADLPGIGTLEVFDVSDLTHPRLAKVLNLGVSLPAHDVTFSSDGRRAYVAALTSTLILDTTNVANPKILGRIIDPTINIHHQADPITLTDPILGTRTFLIVTDEIAGAEGNVACPGGGIHVYDISGRLEKTPLKVGVFEIPDERLATNRTRCTAHVMRMYPDQKKMTIAWYGAGVRVLDLSGLVGVSVGTPATGSIGMGLRQIGWYAFDYTDVWSVKAPVDGFAPDGSFYMFANDQLRGFDVYHFDAKAEPSPSGLWLNPAVSLKVSLANGSQGVQPFCVLRPTAA
jgi:hypothetical protein